MTSTQFVERVKMAVYDSTVRGCLSLLREPPGRRPSEALVALSQWFNGLSAEDQAQVRSTVQLAARSAVFGMLAVLDGVTAIKEPGEAGSLELRYVDAKESVLLNDPACDFLHDEFLWLAPPE